MPGNDSVCESTVSVSSSSSGRPVKRWERWTGKSVRAFLHHIKKHTGIGIVCAVAYFDPGNWGVDLQAGSDYGYRLLFVVLLAGLFAVFLQCLASKLGCVTGLDLASHCRLLLHDRPKHTLWYRWGLHYPLYALSEVAIIATDLAELLGSAIALVMLFPKLKIWHGVLITAFDVLIILFLGDPLRGRPVRSFEVLIAFLVFAVLICMAIIIGRVEIDWGDTFLGYVPSKYIFQSGALYTSVGILGATVMPHSLFLGSALATQDRVSPRPPKVIDDEPKPAFSWKAWISRRWKGLQDGVVFAFRATPSAYATQAKTHSERENNPHALVKAHYVHGMVDIVFSLLGFAVLINSMILILASAVFFYGEGATRNADSASLFDAYDLIAELVGQASATLFALALLAAGQSSSIIATVAGQAVSEGFLRWTVSPVLRRLLTRLMSIIPSMLVAVIVGQQGIDALLVASQVILSICLPFITAPLLILTSSKSVMRVRKEAASSIDAIPVADSSNLEQGDEGWVYYNNSKLSIVIGIIIWLIVVAANVYVLVDLAIQAAT